MNGRPNPDEHGQGSGGNPQSPVSHWTVFLWLFILFILIGPWLSSLLSSKGVRISYSTFRSQLEAGNVEKVNVQGDRISGVLKKPAEEKTQAGTTVSYREFSTYLPSFGDDKLLALLEAQKVDVVTQPKKDVSWWGDLLTGMLPFLLLIGLAVFLLRRGGLGGSQGIFSFVGSRARLYERHKERTTFQDVAGAHGAKIELQEIIDYLRDPARIQRLGGKAPKGVLLVGPPGTGKTLLARAVAGEAQVPFLSITGSDFVELFVGVGASRVRSLFTDAKKMAPVIIFIDELDSIGHKRGVSIGGGQDEREHTLNQLLSEMDGFEPNEHVVVMAATNRPDVLDAALLRPGRFDRRITVDLPSLKDRLEILKIHARGKPLSENVDLEEVARGTPGFSGADLENLLNEAALLAARKNQDRLDEKDVDDAIDKILMGLERENIAITPEERRLVAYHEGGHAVVAAVLPNTDPIHKVTIVPRGQAMGVTQQVPGAREVHLSQGVHAQSPGRDDGGACGRGGRGRRGDQRRRGRSQAGHRPGAADGPGMGHGREPRTDGDGRMAAKTRSWATGWPNGPNTARRRPGKVDEEIKKILKESYDRAVEVLREHRDGLDRVAEDLLKKEEVAGKEILELVGVEKTPAPLEDVSLRVRLDLTRGLVRPDQAQRNLADALRGLARISSTPGVMTSLGRRLRTCRCGRRRGTSA